jgi:hypothetical protein
MQSKIAGLVLAGLLAGAAAAQAASTFEGEWAVNAGESKYPPGFPPVHDHRMQVTKDDGTHVQYMDNFTVGDQPPSHVSHDGAYDGKYYKASDGQMMAYFHTKTSYRDKYTLANGIKGEDNCDFSADGKIMTCHGQFAPPGAKEPVKFLEVWDRTK